jgi:L-rhamnonate dehydratase
VDRREFVAGGAAMAALAASGMAFPKFAWAQEKSGLKITGIRLVETRPTRPYPEFTPAPGAWSTQGVEVANPVSIYPEYKATRSLFAATNVPGFTVEISTDKGITGYGRGGAGGGAIVMGHLAKLMMGRDPFDIERNWDINWRSTMSYGRMGVTMNAISGFDNALWDIIGKALGLPIYELIGGEVRDRIPVYCTGNDIEQHVEFGFKKLKLAIPHGPASGRQGMRDNVKLVERARKALGPDGEIMLDCWMAWTEDYTIEMAKMLEPYRVYWMEEVLQPHDYEGFGRLNEAISSTRIVTGEHEYGRYGFRQLLKVNGAEIWQPDIMWVGGLTELIKIGALAAAYDIPVIPHSGGATGAGHWSISHVNGPWVEMFMPAPGAPKALLEMYKEDYDITSGPEGLYMHPPRKPGWGLDLEVVRVVSG